MTPLTDRRESQGAPQGDEWGSPLRSDSVSPRSAGQRAQEGLSVDHDVPDIEFIRPLPGFPGLRRYVLVQVTAGTTPAVEEAPTRTTPVLYELRGLTEQHVRFLVGVPTAFFPDYVFDLDEGTCAELGLTNAEDALVLVILTIGNDSASTTANLLAPVVINARTRSAAQVILSGTTWPVRAAIV